MKKLFLALSLLLGQIAQASMCLGTNPELEALKSYAQWEEIWVTPSPENPHISYPLLETPSGQVKLGSIAQGHLEYNVSIESSFEKEHLEERFFKSCKRGSLFSTLDSNGIGDPLTQGHFKMVIHFLPQIDKAQLRSIIDETETIQIQFALFQDSSLERSLFRKTQNEISDLMENHLQESLLKSLENGFNGDIVLEFDGNSALACDLMTKKASFFLFHEMTSQTLPKKVRKDLIDFSSFKQIRDKVNASVKSLESPLSTLFLAGFSAQEISISSVKEGESLLVKTFNKSPSESPTTNEDLLCVMDQFAQVNSDQVEIFNRFQIIVNKPEGF